jgi:fatty acid desaturase
MDPQEKARMEREIRQQIVRERRKRSGFAWHAVMFVLVNVAVGAINLRYTPNTMWFVWPLCAWGFGVAAHGFAVYGKSLPSEAETAALVRQEMARRGFV